MSYEPPAGWVESVDQQYGNPLVYGLFHLRQDCERIRHPERLRETDKPYSAARCHICAAA